MKNVIPIYDGDYLLDEVVCVRVKDISSIEFDYIEKENKNDCYTIEVTLKNGTKIKEYINGCNMARYNTYNTDYVYEVALNRINEVLNECNKKTIDYYVYKE